MQTQIVERCEIGVVGAPLLAPAYGACPSATDAVTKRRQLSKGDFLLLKFETTFAICIILAAGIATAHDGTDPLAVWYRLLTTADGKSRCSMHDCAGGGADEGRPLGGLDLPLQCR